MELGMVMQDAFLKDAFHVGMEKLGRDGDNLNNKKDQSNLASVIIPNQSNLEVVVIAQPNSTSIFTIDQLNSKGVATGQLTLVGVLIDDQSNVVT
jgi:hypothetical protein